jgi:hypothetical protein
MPQEMRSQAWLLKSFDFIQRYMWPSLIEALFVLAVSNASLLVLILTHMLDTPNAVFSLTLVEDVITTNVASSEVLIYVLALIAPALWIMMSHWRGRRHLFIYWTLFLFQAVIVIGSAIVYSKAKSKGIANQGFADFWAVLCVILGIGIWYITLVYEKWLPRSLKPPRQESGKAILDDLESGK